MFLLLFQNLTLLFFRLYQMLNSYVSEFKTQDNSLLARAVCEIIIADKL